jgi:hypothetical protein
MRQSRAAGDKLFVDYAGDGVPVVIDRLTGERRAAQIAVLGASSFTYTQATWMQGLADWISGHVGAFQAIGGLPAPDNTKVAVIKACLYDPQINHSYAAMAAHYGTAILPARPRRPRDKDRHIDGPAASRSDNSAEAHGISSTSKRSSSGSPLSSGTGTAGLAHRDRSSTRAQVAA